jgi:hypothetical protein
MIALTAAVSAAQILSIANDSLRELIVSAIGVISCDRLARRREIFGTAVSGAAVARGAADCGAGDQ